MSAGKYNIVAEQGTTFTRTLNVSSAGVAWDLTSYSARMQVRVNAAASSTVLSLVSPTNISLSSLGVITITISASAMAAVTAGKYVYDLELVSAGGVVTRLLEGKFVVKAEVTR